MEDTKKPLLIGAKTHSRLSMEKVRQGCKTFDEIINNLLDQVGK